MVLAGGAGIVAAAGCTGATGSGDAGPEPNFCCNANGDPCCPSDFCGQPVSAACTEKKTCEADGGVWNYGSPDGQCLHPQDAAPDALEDGATPVGIFCCNANGDPCCPSLYCDAAVSTACMEKMACEADGGTWNFNGCTSDGGAHDAGPDDHGQAD
jgi:hypothetical protein